MKVKRMNFSNFGGTGSCPWITLECGCYCQTSEVNSELSTTPVVDTAEVNSEIEEGRATPERVRSETCAETATLCQCPRTHCPSKRGQNKKRKNKKSKINGIRNPALETNSSLFPESNDDPVSEPECWYLSHYQHECDHSEEFPCGDWDHTYCDSHGARERGPEFIRGEAQGADFIHDMFEFEPDHCVEIFQSFCLHLLVTAVKSQKRELDSYYIGYFHGALQQINTLSCKLCKKEFKTLSCKKEFKTLSCKKQLKTRSSKKQLKTRS